MSTLDRGSGFAYHAKMNQKRLDDLAEQRRAARVNLAVEQEKLHLAEKACHDAAHRLVKAESAHEQARAEMAAETGIPNPAPPRQEPAPKVKKQKPPKE